MLAQLKKDYEKQGVYFISLTIEENDNAKSVDDWLNKSHAPNLRAARSSDKAKSQLHKAAGLAGVAIPAVILVSADGTVAQGFEAPFTREALVKAVKALASE